MAKNNERVRNKKYIKREKISCPVCRGKVELYFTNEKGELFRCLSCKKSFFILEKLIKSNANLQEIEESFII